MTTQTQTIRRVVGEPVTCNGYPGRITRVCEWSNTLVEVRLESGTVCVSIDELTPQIQAR